MNSQYVHIAPSILSADFARLGEEVQAIERSGADRVHFDVMDNHYVPNLTIGPLVCKAIRSHVNIDIDVHLMVEPVDSLIPMFAEAGANIITFHPEASRHVERSLQLIRSCGCQSGLVLNPASPLEWIDYALDAMDGLLLMTVNPGFGGQSFIESSLAKIAAARKKLDAYQQKTGRHIWLEVDGGIKIDNIGAIAQAGAQVFVAGSAVFGSPDADGYYKTIIEQLKISAKS